LRGVRAELPILIGVLPFGMIYGVLAIDVGIPSVAAQSMSAIVFAGSSQFLATQLIHLQTPALVVILSIFVVNLRHALYSASLAPYLQPLRPAWKLLLGYLLTDEAYAVTIAHYQSVPVRSPDYRHWYFLGSGLALWSTWQISTYAGIYLGAVVPASWSLDFTLLCYGLPYKLGLIIAACVGILVGVWAERPRLSADRVSNREGKQ